MTTGVSGITSSFYQDIYPTGTADDFLPKALRRPKEPAPASGVEASFSDAGKALSRQSPADGQAEASDVTPEQKAQIDKLKETDRKVQTHEQAHMAAGGGLVTGGATYTYKTGPDGKQYAVAGEVHIDTSEERDPSATLRKAERIKAAALAPADPSGQDRSVAASADAMATKARQELAQSQGGQGGQQTASSGGKAAAGAGTSTAPASSTVARAQSAYGAKSHAASATTNLTI